MRPETTVKTNIMASSGTRKIFSYHSNKFYIFSAFLGVLRIFNINLHLGVSQNIFLISEEAWMLIRPIKKATASSMHNNTNDVPAH